MNSMQKNNWLLIVPLYISVIILSLVLYGYSFPTSNLFTDIPYIQAILDPQLYPQDFYVQEAINFTPRYYYQYLIVIPVKLGINISFVYFGYYLLAFTSLILGLYAIGRIYDPSNLAGAVITFLVLAGQEMTLGYTSIFRTEPIPAIYAMGLSIWGIYFCLRQRWIRGYLFFGLASWLQFLVGVLPSLLFLPILLLSFFRNKSVKELIFPLVILGIFASLVYVPMLITGTTNSDKMSHSEFVYWYGYVRHPHHIIPSSFPRHHWRSFVFFTGGGIFCIMISKLLVSREKLNFIIVIATSILALFIGYVFVELMPISFVAKLQLARTTPFTQIIVIIVISTIFVQYFQQKNLTVCSIFLITPIIKNGAILFGLSALVLAFLETKQLVQITRSKLLGWIILITLLILFAFYPLPSSVWDGVNRVFWKGIFFLVLCLPFLVKNQWLSGSKRRLGIWSLAFVSVLYFISGLFQVIPRQWPSLRVTKTITPSTIGLQFRNRSPQDALILIPPDNTRFRLDSQRSVVLDFRSLPFTDLGIREWSKRFNILISDPKISDPKHYQNFSKNRTNKYSEFSNEELVNIAKTFGANYILTRKEWHPDIQEQVIAQEGQWIIYKIDN